MKKGYLRQHYLDQVPYRWEHHLSQPSYWIAPVDKDNIPTKEVMQIFYRPAKHYYHYLFPLATSNRGIKIFRQRIKWTIF